MKVLIERANSCRDYLDRIKRYDIAKEAYRALNEAFLNRNLNRSLCVLYVNLPKRYFKRDVIIKFYETCDAEELEPGLGWGGFDVDDMDEQNRLAFFFSEKPGNFNAVMERNSTLFYEFDIGKEIDFVI